MMTRPQLSYTHILCLIIFIKSYTNIKDTIQKTEFINTTLETVEKVQIYHLCKIYML